MNLSNYEVFRLDISNQSLQNITSDVTNTDFEPYLVDLISSINQANSRNFNFQRPTTEVRLLVDNILSGQDFTDRIEVISNRLLSTETEAQQKIEHLGREIQRGVLISALIDNNGDRQFFICKADHLEFLNERDFKRTRGLPTKKKIFKAFLAEISSNNSITSVLVYDTNSIMAKYWWLDFLELEPIYDDAHNTSTALEALDAKVFRKIKKKHPADHTYLRNSSIRYFRSKEEFQLNDFIEELFRNYTPEDQTLDVDKLVSSAQELPSSVGFDNRFTIDKAEIKKRQTTKFKLSEQIDLIVKSDIEIGTTIKAVQDEDGQKYVKIRSDEGFERFKRG